MAAPAAISTAPSSMAAQVVQTRQLLISYTAFSWQRDTGPSRATSPGVACRAILVGLPCVGSNKL
eukprot:scaffold15665_cov70-Phaeocystis_antarctica.AAC.1